MYVCNSNIVCTNKNVNVIASIIIHEIKLEV